MEGGGRRHEGVTSNAASRRLIFTFSFALAFFWIALFAHGVEAKPAPASEQSLQACFDNFTDYGQTLKNIPGHSYPNATIMALATGQTGGMMGDYYLCQSLPAARACTVEVEIPGICKISNLSDPSGAGITPQCTMGICVPNTCNDTILNQLNDTILFILQSSNGTFLNEAKGIQFFCEGGDPPPLSTGAIITLCVVGVLVLLCIAGTVVDLYCNDESVWLFPWMREKDVSMYDQLENEDNFKSGTKYHDHSRTKYRHIRAFSLTTNLKRLLAPIPGGLEAFNGLRVLSIMWVILGHTYGFVVGFSLNNVYMYDVVLNHRFFQFVPNGEYAVDTFFFISGFLVTYFLYKRLREKGIRRFFPKEFFLYYLHRILRIMPLYMFVLLIYSQLEPWMGDGPFWFSTRASLDAVYDNCWANVLFINNFIPYEFYNQCMGWSWFLAVDFQFYILTPFYILLYYFNRAAGILLMTLTFATSIFTQGFLADKYNMSWSFFNQVTNEDYFNLLYGRPWTRCSPYIIGMATALFLQEISLKKDTTSLFDDYPPSTRDRRRQRIPAWMLSIFYLLAFAFLGLTVFGTFGSENWNHWQTVGFIAVNRTFFTFGVAILMFIFALDYGGWLRSLLSVKIWDPLAKLTYGAYLVHYIVLQIVFGSQPGFIYYSNWNITYWFLATTILSYIGAAACYLLVEKPLMTLESLLLSEPKE